MKNETCHKCGKSSCDKNCSENLSLPNGMSEKLCTSKSTQELKTEEEAFKKLDVFKKISFVKEIETGYEFIYENLSDKLAIELIDFLKLERKCCPTYNYALHVDSKSKTIRYQRFGSQQIKDELKIYLQHIGLLP